MIFSRSKITISNLNSWRKGLDYLSLPNPEKRTWVPPAREDVADVTTFLKSIGRSMDQYSSKFQNWSDLFTFSSSKLSSLGLKISDRKYLMSCREWYKRGMNLPNAPIKIRPNRRKIKNS